MNRQFSESDILRGALIDWIGSMAIAAGGTFLIVVML